MTVFVTRERVSAVVAGMAETKQAKKKKKGTIDRKGSLIRRRYLNLDSDKKEEQRGMPAMGWQMRRD